MALSAQDKILYVANKLGLTSLKDMQATTGAVFATDNTNPGSGQVFNTVGNNVYNVETNLSDNRFEVNEALLVESISFGVNNFGSMSYPVQYWGSNIVVVFDLVIGNKTVLKNTPIWLAGGPNTFASVGLREGAAGNEYIPRAQIFLEGAGILIPPQVEFYINYSLYNTTTGAKLSNPRFSQFTLFGTQVLLNFNTSL
tara:strand:- start:279 stop:872 length:594 start_codon:yes stop_codon:yes gene_type:complete